MSDQIRIAELERALNKVQTLAKTAYERGVTSGRLSCNNQVREALVSKDIARRAVADENARFTELLEASEAETERLRKALRVIVEESLQQNWDEKSDEEVYERALDWCKTFHEAKAAESEAKAAMALIAETIGCKDLDWKSIILELNDFANK